MVLLRMMHLPCWWEYGVRGTDYGVALQVCVWRVARSSGIDSAQTALGNFGGACLGRRWGKEESRREVIKAFVSWQCFVYE